MTALTDVEDLLQVHITRVFDATPEEIFAAFTEPEQLVQWWGPAGFFSDKVEADPTAGGAFSVNMRAEDGSYEGVMSGRFIEIAAPTRLVLEITKHCNGAAHLFDATKMPPTTITVELRALADGRTELTLTQTGFTDPVAADAHRGGWSGSLEKLSTSVETN
ncbi:MAG: SRPBCC domain-containing protein [Alphaproteobacteria bacterium]|nr:SRPBCC domain-containing protein [Alphaproteobacteria bacterium]